MVLSHKLLSQYRFHLKSPNNSTRMISFCLSVFVYIMSLNSLPFNSNVSNALQMKPTLLLYIHGHISYCSIKFIKVSSSPIGILEIFSSINPPTESPSSAIFLNIHQIVLVSALSNLYQIIRKFQELSF